MTQKTLGTKIKALRKECGLTQASLAEMLGVTDKAVSKWERDLSFPDISLFPRLADILGVTMDDLLKDEFDEVNASRLVRIFRMSHDIRTPLHMILGCASLAELYPNDLERIHRYLKNIIVSGEYLLQTFDQLMEITQQTGDSSFEPEMGTAVEEVLNLGPDDRLDYDFSGKRILLVEDMALNREIASELIRLTGADLDYAEDGLICCKMVEEMPAGTYDLILMDIQMPNMDGLEATRQIRALEDPAKADIPIIAMTANVYEKDRKTAMEAGMNAFTGKPFVVDQLYEIIQSYL